MKRIISVEFLDDSGNVKARNTSYSYFTDDPKIAVDDYCVVLVSGNPRLVQVMQIEGLSTSQINKACKWIVCRIDMEEYKARQARESMIKDPQNQLDEELRAHNRMAILAAAAAVNPNIGTLLARLAEIDDNAKAALEAIKPPQLSQANDTNKA